MRKTEFEITGTQLKLIAVITMLIDHIGAGILMCSEMLTKVIYSDFAYSDYMTIYKVFRGIGRMAFPIYCFMLVEGFFYTHNRLKYAARLLFVAVISEIPFDMLFKEQIFYPKYNNVLWELLLGLFVLWGLEYIDNKEFPQNNRIINSILMVVIATAGMAIGYFGKLDYGWAGICCISVMYKLHGYTTLDRIKAFGGGVFILGLMSRPEMLAFLLLIPMYFYKGNRGKDSIALRRFFYLFYPVHMVLLVLIRNLII